MGVRILIVDDHEIVRAGLKAYFLSRNLDVVGEAADAEQALSLLVSAQPNVAILDLRLGNVDRPYNHDGLELLSRLRGANPDLHVIAFSAFPHPAFISRCIQLGARDFILKGDPLSKLADAIKAALSGETSFSRDDHRKMTGALSTPRLNDDIEAPLTNRECDVLRRLGDGATNKKIAEQLGISYETVKEHVQNILKKIGVADRTQAAVWAMRRGLLGS
jgi:DNA-binding NarL/FixJ family response regulator